MLRIRNIDCSLGFLKGYDDADYKTLLTAIEEAGQYLKKITRFSMKEFKPSPHYIREMKRYGILHNLLGVKILEI